MEMVLSWFMKKVVVGRIVLNYVDQKIGQRGVGDRERRKWKVFEMMCER